MNRPVQPGERHLSRAAYNVVVVDPEERDILRP